MARWETCPTEPSRGAWKAQNGETLYNMVQSQINAPMKVESTMKRAGNELLPAGALEESMIASILNGMHDKHRSRIAQCK